MMERAGYQTQSPRRQRRRFPASEYPASCPAHRTGFSMRQFAGEDQQRVDGGILLTRNAAEAPAHRVPLSLLRQS